MGMKICFEADGKVLGENVARISTLTMPSSTMIAKPLPAGSSMTFSQTVRLGSIWGNRDVSGWLGGSRITESGVGVGNEAGDNVGAGDVGEGVGACSVMDA